MQRIMTFRTVSAFGILALLLALAIFWPSGSEQAWRDFDGRLTEQQQALLNARRARQSAVPKASEVVAIVGPYIRHCPGAVVVGLIDPKRQVILGWGKDLGGHKAGGDTIFETASVSKPFTGLLLAQMVQDGKVNLEEPVQNLIKVHVPTFGAEQVTLRQLATHSSGFPAWPDNRGNTTAAYTERDLCCYLQQASLMGQPDSGVLYSNTAFALLGQVLAEKEGTTFDGLLKKRICEPLGMKNTSVALTRAKRSRLAIGHWPDGSPAPSSAPTASGGADGVRSTVHDLLKLVSAYIGIQPTDFQQAMKLSCERYIPFNERIDAGLGWFVDTNDDTVEKSGKISGYRSHVAFSPQHHVGVVILAGAETFPSPEVGKKLLQLMMQRRDLIESGVLLE